MKSIHDVHQLRLDELEARRERAYAGGGEKSTARHKKKGKMTARERIDFLLDDPESWLELGLHAADGMYEEYGGANSAGVVTGLGTVSGRRVMIVANDATVKAGAWFPMTAKKTCAHKKLPCKTASRRFTSSIARAHSSPCSTSCLPTKGTSVRRSSTTPA